MAKHCSICNQSYPDALEHCPHCEAAAKHEKGHEPIHGMADPGDGGEDVIEVDWSDVEGSEPPAAGPGPGPKTTRLAGRSRPSTMLAKPDEQEELSGPLHEAKHADSSGKGPGKAAAGQESHESDDTELIEFSEVEEDLPEPHHKPAPVSHDIDETIDIEHLSRSEESSEVRLGEDLKTDLGGSESLDFGGDSMRTVQAAGPSSDDAASAFLDEDATHQLLHSEESSAVDLGSSPDLQLPASQRSDKGPIHEDFEETIEEKAKDPDATIDATGMTFDESEAEAEVAEAEETEAEAEVEEEGPVTRTKKPRYARRWLGGGVLGLLVGVGASMGLWLAGIEPPPEWRTMVGMAPKKTTATAVTQQPTILPATLESTRRDLYNGDFDQVLKDQKEVPEQGQDRADRLAARGQAKWLAYLQQQKRKGPSTPLKASDPEVKEAISDLEAAKNADGLFWLGQVKENTSDLAGARKAYQEGVTKFKSNPGEQRLFQAALDRLDSIVEEKAAGGNKPVEDKPATKTQSRLSGEIGTADGAVNGMLLLLVALQAPPAAVPEKAPAPTTEPKPGAVPPGTTEAKPVAATKSDTEESGFEFWKALRLAKNQDFAKAIDALQKARANHEDRRFIRLRKSQNPTSDPTEEIFLRCCDELQSYMVLKQKLLSAGYLDMAKQTDAGKALDDILAELKEKKGAGDVLAAVTARLMKEKEVTSKDPEIKEVAKDIDLILDAKKAADSVVAAIRTALTAEKYVTETQKDVVKGIEKLVKDKKDASESLTATAKILAAEKYVGEENPNVPQGVEKLLGDRKSTEEKLQQATASLKSATDTLSGVSQKLAAGKFVQAGAKSEELLKGLDRAVNESASPVASALGKVTGEMSQVGNAVIKEIAPRYDAAARLTADQIRIAGYKTMLLQTRTPQQMLAIWVPVLQERQDQGLAEKAVRDARNVESGQVDVETRAQAAYVEGLALRNQLKFDEARQALQRALANPGKDTGWRTDAQQVLKQLTVASAFYLPRAQKLRAAGNYQEAIQVLDTGVLAFSGEGKTSKEAGKLLALRSLTYLDVARSRATQGLAPADPLVSAAIKDASAAVAAGATAEGSYARGRAAEETGDLANAMTSYQKALEAGSGERTINRYRLALARVLVHMHRDKSRLAPPPPMPEKAEKSAALFPGRDGSVDVQTLAAFITLLLVGVGDEVDAPPPTPDLDKAIMLADEAIRAGENEGHLIRALAWAKREGKWTEALREYVLGLQKLNLPQGYASGLLFLLDNHPAFKIPDVLKAPNPLLANKHYSAGLNHYWNGRYGLAEKDFGEAVSYAGKSGQDARYLYFLGLAQLLQGRRDDALEAFRQASDLEKQSRPTSAAVSAALERVQGSPRKVLNDQRP